ncbi:uncharacterized protein LOC143693362 isoform X2 [Agelaius phoeniceus]|uniref:uncharacterized protein LOC143693362 isoform X2 n=1 Tax=Agelaius phoeniceus TaxID=39638 RepID=UPI004054C5E0
MHQLLSCQAPPCTSDNSALWENTDIKHTSFRNEVGSVQVIKSGTYLCSSANSQHQTSVSKAMGSQVRGLEDQVGLWPDRAGRRRPSPFALPGHPSYRRRAGTSSPGLCARPRATRALPADNGNLRGLHACGRRHREMRDGQRDETPLPRAGPPRPRLPPCHGRPLAPRPPPPRGRD